MNSLYIVDPITKGLVCLDVASYTDMGIRERQDLQEWIAANPEILGEPLFVIGTEFRGWDSSNRRIDILAIDKKNQTLTVIELKLDIAGKHADLQSLRYAAFCSTMHKKHVIEAVSRYRNISYDAAAELICEFLGADEVPDFSGEPRIILAAFSFDDIELTSLVLWLRRFKVNIKCVELRPFRAPDGKSIILKPRQIIPLPEAEDYQVRVEEKESVQEQENQQRSELLALWQSLSLIFNDLNPKFNANGRSRKFFLQVRTGVSQVHYEWLLRRNSNLLDVALHFELPTVKENEIFIEILQQHIDHIKQGITFQFICGPFGKKWRQLAFQIPYTGKYPNNSVLVSAANIMKILIERTWPLLEAKLLNNEA
jgi:hypothetical protein